MHRNVTAPSFFVFLACLACGHTWAQQDRPAWSAPELERAVSIVDGRTGQPVSFSEFLDTLSKADVVFLGESHTDETTHRVELAVYEGLLQRRDNRVVLAMEMFERDVQSSLDKYLAGEIDEAQFTAHTRPWSNYRTGYRPLIERAKKAGKPVIASNFPKPLRMQVATKGAEAVKTLQQDNPEQIPAEFYPNTKEYWKRVDNAVRGHMGMMPNPGGDDQRLYSTQSLWDNSMGEACANALKKHPNHSVLHVNGGFHSAYWDGTVHQLKQRTPDANIKTVAIIPVSNPSVAEAKGSPVADFVVYAEARATDFSDETWSVSVDRALKYRFHLPETNDDDAPIPLLIWLSDDGFNAEDGMELWQQRLGDEVALAVIEPPYRETQADASLGGRWYWSDTFAGDVGAMIVGVERVWGYLLRNYPIDPQRVCVAGEGTGATVAAAVALLTDRMDISGVAITPSHYSKLKEFPLPLPESWGDETPPARSIQVLGPKSLAEWWGGELDQYKGVGVKSQLVTMGEDPWNWEVDTENALRLALGLSPCESPPANERAYILVETNTPRARHWARLQAMWLSQEQGIPIAATASPPAEGNAARISTELRPEAFLAKGALPRCPGPFGGTTVLVLPENASQEVIDDWKSLEENDPLAKESRFHRIRIACARGEPLLHDVLTKLKSENRKNVLIAPAVFCSGPAWMRSMTGEVRDLENEMTLQWIPGLGGRKAALSVDVTSDASIPVHYKLDVGIAPESGLLNVEGHVRLPRHLRKQGTVFSLSSAMKIQASRPVVETVAGEEGPVRRYRLKEDAEKGKLELTYRGKVDFGLSDQKEEYTRGFRETRGIIGPQGIYLDNDSAWVPRFDDAMIQFAVTVNLPDGWHIISQGGGSSRTDDGQAHWESESPMEQIYLVGGPLQRTAEAAGAVELLVYLRESDDALTQKYLDAGARYLEMYRQLIGPYPYSKFALVENFWETGYGMPSFTLLGPQVIRFPFILHSSYPHEILHNWWGNSVFVDYESGNWCEGLTAYMSDHLIQEQRGVGSDYRRNTLQKYRDYVKDGRDFPLVEFRSRHSAATEAVGYGKALMLFHMLRQDLGDDAFRSALASFYRKQRGKRASFTDVRHEFEAVAQRDLGAFFSQWTERSGAPVLAVSNVKVKKMGDRYSVTGTLKQTQVGPPYALNVPVGVVTDSSTKQLTMETSEKETAFQFEIDSLPTALWVDPAFDLFRILDARETPPSIGQLFGEPQIVAVLPSEADAATVKAYRQLMNSWQSEDHKIELVSDQDLNAIPADRALWILGRQNRWTKKLFGKHLISKQGKEDRVDLVEQELAFADHSLVVIRRHPQSLERAVGWLAIEPQAAFAGMGRKLPHYGKYSYLAFQGDEPTNIVKGQWDTTNSPLSVVLADRGELVAKPKVSRAPLAKLPPIFSSKAMQEHVAWLAAPEREGRGLGSEGLKQSAKYIAEKFAAAGLKPGGKDGSWLQQFTVEQGPNGEPTEAINVIGILPGKRADWSEQSIVLGAHYDHLGFGWPDARAGAAGKLHAGADDNASGIAVLLELAKNLTPEGGGSRNLVFVAFSAEECGRWGSKHYVEHSTFPAEQIRGMINLDTVGRLGDRPLAIHGTGTADEWQHIFRGCGFVTGIANRIVPEAADASDQMSFIEAQIPAVQIFTGAHEDYHRPSDTVDKIDVAGLVKVATFVKEAVNYMLEREPPLTSRIAGAAAPTAAPSGSGRRVLFGTVPAFDYQGKGVKIESLVTDSPAAQAGLKPGDVLVRIDGKPIKDLRAFSDILKTLKPNQQVKAVVQRQGQETTVNVTVRER